MSKQKLEQVLEYLINEEEEKARDLLHSVFVEKARSIHESLIEDEDEDIDEALDDKETDEEVDESAKSDWEEEITQEDDEIGRHSNEIDHEEEVGEADDGDDIEDAEAVDDLDDMEIGGDDDDVEPEGDAEEAIPAKLDDLEAAVEELKAEFDKLMAGDGDEDVPAEDEMDMGDMGDDMEMEIAPEEAIHYESKEEDDDAEELDEAASLSAVKAVSGGDDDNTKSPIGNQANNPGLSGGGEPVDFAGGDEKGGSADKPAEGMTTNQEAKLSAGPKAEAGDKSDKGAKSLVKDLR